MYKKYIFPINLFLVFEHLNKFVFTAKNINNNTYFLKINHKWFFLISTFFKKELINNNSILIEHSAIDTFKYSDSIKNIFLKNRILNFFLFYFYTNKNRIILMVNNDKLFSIEKTYKNSN